MNVARFSFSVGMGSGIRFFSGTVEQDNKKINATIEYFINLFINS